MKNIVLFFLLLMCVGRADAQFVPEKLTLVAVHETPNANACIVFGRVALFPSGAVAAGRPLVFDPNVGLFLEGNLFSTRMPVMAAGTTFSDHEAVVFDRSGAVWVTRNGGVDWKRTGSVSGEPVGALAVNREIWVWTRDGRLSVSKDRGTFFQSVDTAGKVQSLVASGSQLLALTDKGTLVSSDSETARFEGVTAFEGKPLQGVFPSPTGFWGATDSRVFRSRDGKTWELAFSGDLYKNESVSSIAWDSTDVGVVVTDRGALFLTYDGGRTWSRTRYRIGDRWRSATWVAGRLLVLGSERLYVFSKRGEGLR